MTGNSNDNTQYFFNGPLLKKIRKNMGLSRASLANMTNLVTEDAIRHIENGRTRKPRTDTVKSLAVALKLPERIFYDSLNSSPLSSSDILFQAWQHEVNGDFEAAYQAYSQALNSGNNHQVETRRIKEQAYLNEFLFDEIRKKHSPGGKQTLIPTYDSPRDLQLSLSQMNLGQGMRLMDKRSAHIQGRLHHTVILLFLLDERIAYYVRADSQEFSGQYDFLGGHSIALLPANRLETAEETARREAREEMNVFAGRDRIEFDFPLERLAQVEYNLDGKTIEHSTLEDGAIETIVNREISTVFLASLPSHPFLEFAVFDENKRGEAIVSISRHELLFDKFEDLVDLRNREVSEKIDTRDSAFADGARRVLDKYRTDKSFKAELDKKLP